MLGWLLLAIGVWMRISFPDWIEFREDERYALAEASRALHEGGLAHGLRGSHSNVMPPFFPLFFVPIVAWTTDPVAASWWVVLWNLSALAVLLLLLRRAFGERLAVLATALFASLPLATIYARKVWQPDLIVPFTFPLFLALLSLSERWRRAPWIAAVVLYALVCQVHASAWFLAPGLLAFLVLQRIRPPPLDLAIGVAVALALYSSYLLYELRTGFDDLAFVIDSKPASGASLAGAGGLLVGNFKTSLESTAPALESILGPSRAALAGADPLLGFSRVATMIFNALCAAATLASLGASAALLVRTGLRGPRTLAERVRLLFALVFTSVLLGFVVEGITPVLHYHVVLFPCVTFFFIDTLARILRGRAGWLLAPAVSVLVIGHGLLWLSIHRIALESPHLEGGAFSPLDGADLDACRRRIPVYIDEALHREERWRASQALLAARFAGSARTLLSVDVSRNDPPSSTRGRGTLSPGPDGLSVTGAVRLGLPEFAADDSRPAILRLELSLPQEERLIVYRTEPGVEALKASRAIPAWVPAGREVLHVELPAGQGGSLLLLVRMHRWVIHSCEIRAVGD